MSDAPQSPTPEDDPREVLVVDDEELNVRVIRTMLDKNGYTPRVARSGAEAIEAIGAGQALPAVILLDIMMPEMSGLEVLERVRSSPRTSSIPVILLTAKAQSEDLMTGYQAGADYYITKPFTAKQLIYGIRLVLGELSAG